jgi:hypothetical protein
MVLPFFFDRQHLPGHCTCGPSTCMGTPRAHSVASLCHFRPVNCRLFVFSVTQLLSSCLPSTLRTLTPWWPRLPRVLRRALLQQGLPLWSLRHLPCQPLLTVSLMASGKFCTRGLAEDAKTCGASSHARKFQPPPSSAFLKHMEVRALCQPVFDLSIMSPAQ